MEADTPGFTKGRKLDKIGQKSADTAELSNTEVRVSVSNLIGEENRGLYHPMRNLPAERLGIAIHAVAQARWNFPRSTPKTARPSAKRSAPSKSTIMPSPT